MDKDEILERSRRENSGQDLAEMSIATEAGSAAARVGAALCVLVTVISMRMSNIILCSPWVIYFGILGTGYIVRYKRAKRRSDLYLSCVFFLMLITALVFLFVRLRGAAL